MTRLVTFLFLPAVLSAQADAPPAAERERVLQTVGAFARDYIDHLPDFICQRVTQHNIRDAGATDWKPQIKIGEELTYFKHQERYRVFAVNDSPAKKLPNVRPALVSSAGDFGNTLNGLFQPDSQATFEWKGWKTVRGKRAWTFSFHTPSGYDITDCHSVAFHLGTCKTAHYPRRGVIYLAEDGLTLLRLDLEPENLPSYRERRTVDYGPVSIGGTEYLLPVADVFERLTDKTHFRNESTYRDYRKFSADSTIKIAPEGDAIGPSRSLSSVPALSPVVRPRE